MSDPIDACGPAEERMSEEEREPDGPILATMVSTIRGCNWNFARYAEVPGGGVLAQLQALDGPRRRHARANRNSRSSCRSYLALKVPAERRAAVAEFIARVNYKCFIGAFDLDFENGSVRFRCGIDVEGGTLTEKMVDNLFGMTSYMADVHHDRLMQVIYGGRSRRRRWRPATKSESAYTTVPARAAAMARSKAGTSGSK